MQVGDPETMHIMRIISPLFFIVLASCHILLQLILLTSFAQHEDVQARIVIAKVISPLFVGLHMLEWSKHWHYIYFLVLCHFTKIHKFFCSRTPQGFENWGLQKCVESKSIEVIWPCHVTCLLHKISYLFVITKEAENDGNSIPRFQGKWKPL